MGSTTGVARGQGRRWVRWSGAALCVLAGVVVLIPLIAYARVALDGDEVRLSDGPNQVSVPAGKTWGVYVDDANNSGFTMSCSGTDDATGEPIAMRDPWATISGSETETLEYLFDTGSGELTISCRVPGEEVSIRPAANLNAVVLGFGLAFVPAGIGVGLLLGRLRVAGWVLLGGVVLVGLGFAAKLAVQAVLSEIGENIVGDAGVQGEYYEVPETRDPALIALGNRFLAEVAAPAGAVRAPSDAPCWMPGVALCRASEEPAM